MTGIPHTLARAVVDVHGAIGTDWLARLPATLSDCARRWSLDISPPFEPLSYNYVAPAVRADGTAVVLKAGVPCRETETEVAALALYDGRGGVRLLEWDAAAGVMLLERAVPGTTLRAVEDDELATRVAADVMQRLWRTAPDKHSFPTVGEWAAGLRRLRAQFDGGTGPFPTRLVERAESLFVELLASMDEPVVLHGDLHHWNILSAEREPWLAIDPKGVVGEAAYEVGALLRNPLPELLAWPHPARVLGRRLDILAERLGFDRERMIQWSFSQAVLSAWWFHEDHGRGWEPTLEFARIMETL